MRHFHCTVHNLTSTCKAFINESMAHISSECWSESVFSPFFVTCVSNSAMVLGSVEVTGTNFAISPTLSVISPIFCNRLWLNKISKMFTSLLYWLCVCMYCCLVLASIYSVQNEKNVVFCIISALYFELSKNNISKKKKISFKRQLSSTWKKCLDEHFPYDQSIG